MKKIILDDIKDLEEKYTKIGYGTYIDCYLYNEKTVMKIFKNSDRQCFFGKININNLEQLAKLENNNFHFVSHLVYYKDILIGILMKYIKGNTLKQGLSKNILLNDLYIKYDEVVKNIKPLSDKNVVMNDICSQNIIYNNNGFHIIDTLDFIINNIFSKERCYKDAKDYLDHALIKCLINSDKESFIYFNKFINGNKELKELYYNVLLKNKSFDLKYFLEILKYEVEKYKKIKIKTIGQLQK